VNITGSLWSTTVVDINAGITINPCKLCDQTISISKVVNGTPPQTDWSFTSNIPGHTSFTIPAAGGAVTFSGVPVGSYTVTEVAKDVPGTSPARQYSVSNSCGTGNVANITVGACEYQSCTFTNSCESELTVTKVFNNSNPLINPVADWSFTISPALGGISSFTLPVSGGSRVFSNVPLDSTYTITEIARIDSTCLDLSDFVVTNSYGSGNTVAITIAGCPDTAFSFINTPPSCSRCSLVVTVNSPSICQGELPATITASVNTPGSYTYSWTVPSGAINPGNVASFSASVAGEYSVVVSDGLFCSVSDTGIFTINPNPTVTVNSPSRCSSGSSVTITATPSPSGTYNYVWTVPPGVSDPGNVASFSATVAGTYSVIVTIPGTTCSGSGSGTLTVNTDPSVTVNSPSRCASGSAVTITATPTPSGTYNYSWTVPPGASDPGNVASFSASVAGSYSVTITNPTTGCTGSGSGTLTVNSNPTVTVNSPARCSSDPSVTITATPSPSGSYNYSWTVPPGASDPGNVASFSATVAGTYSVVITNPTTGCTGSGSGTLTITANPTVSVNSPTRCSAGPGATITATPSPLGTYNYSWTVPPGASNPGNVASFTATVAGTYSVIITVPGNSCSGSGSGTLTVNVSPTVTVNSPSRCSNGSAVTITATPAPSGSYNYVWTVPPGMSNPGNVASFFASMAGTYSVVITHPTTGCTGSGSGSLTVNPIPTVTCSANNLNQTLTANPSGGTAPYTYSWNTSPVKTSQTITVTDENLYTVTVTDSKGCTATTSCSVNTCNGFTTVTQGGWGAPPKGNNPARYLSRKFSQAFPAPDYLTIGCSTGNKLRLTSASAIEIFLPSGSTPRALPAGTLVDPGQAYQNVLAGQLVAATLNIKFDDTDPTFGSSHISLRDLIVNYGPFAGWTVGQVVAEANKLIGGCPSIYSFTQMNNALDLINNNFDYGIVNRGYLSCPGTFPLAQVFSKSVVQNSDEIDVPAGSEVMIYPNPFREITRIRFRAEQNDVNGRVEIFSPDGKEVATIFNQRVKAGEYYITEFNYPQLPAGVYIYRISVGTKVINGRLVKVR
jgi:hypothetical protein